MKTNSTIKLAFAFGKIIFTIILLIIIGISWWNVYVYVTYFQYQKNVLAVRGSVLGAYVVDTEEQRMQGLSEKGFLPSGMSMLFVFDKPDTYGIWMKDMNFPLDIVWLDKDKKIIYTLSHVDPSTYPHVFYPPTEALYVLEVRSGFLENQGIKVGDMFYFED